MNCEDKLEIQVQCLCLNIIPSPIQIKHQLADLGLVLDIFSSGALIGDVSYTGDGIKPREYVDLRHAHTHTQDNRKMGI